MAIGKQCEIAIGREAVASKAKGAVHMNMNCSPDGKYRYWKEVELSDDYGVCLFLMLNPATEEESVHNSHRTLEKCKKFARQWGYGTLWTCNLFALRSPDPKKLKRSPDPVGPDNDSYILKYARQANKIVCAWGNHGAYLDRGVQVLKMLEGAGLSHKIFDLGLTKKHQPKQPLYLPDSQKEFPLDIKLIDRPENESLVGASNRFLQCAEECLSKGDLSGASENAWNAVEYYLKVVAESRDWPNRTTRDVCAIATDLSEETDDPYEAHLTFAALVGSASAIHEGWLPDYQADRDVRNAKVLIALFENRPKPQPESRPSQANNEHNSGCACAECRDRRKSLLASIRAKTSIRAKRG
jgi:hypothetical protein